MAYDTPPTFAALEVVSVDELQTLSDDITDLDRRSTLKFQTISTPETTTSTSYVDLSTPGPACTVNAGTTSGLVLVILSCNISNSGAFSGAMAVSISGATTLAADDAYSFGTLSAARASFVIPFVFSAGVSTVTAKYRVTGGTGTFGNRSIAAIPLGA